MESYLSKCAAGLAPPDWLTQTTWSGQSGPRVFQHRTKLRPMRPKPLIATLILSSATTVFLTAACKRKETRAEIAGQSSKSGEESHQRGKIYINVCALCFSSFEHPLPPFIFASFGGPYYPLFWGRSTSLQDIWKHTPRARHHHQHSTKRSPLDGVLYHGVASFVSFRRKSGDSFSCERVVVVVSRRSVDRWSDRFGSRVISLHFFSLSFSVSRYHLLSVWPFRENAHKTIEKREREKAYLSDGAVLELAGDSRELRELGGLRREMRVRLRVERSDRRLSRTNAVRGTFCEKRLLHTFSSSNNTQMRIEHPKKKKKKKETPRVKLPEDHARCPPRANVETRRVDRNRATRVFERTVAVKEAMITCEMLRC